MSFNSLPFFAMRKNEHVIKVPLKNKRFVEKLLYDFLKRSEYLRGMIYDDEHGEKCQDLAIVFK